MSNRGNYPNRSDFPSTSNMRSSSGSDRARSHGGGRNEEGIVRGQHNKFRKGNDGNRKKGSSNEERPAPRPEFHDETRTVSDSLVDKHVAPSENDQTAELISNFEQVHLQDEIVKKYLVTFSPPIDKPGLKLKVLRQREIKCQIGANDLDYVFDGETQLFSSKRFDDCNALQTTLNGKPQNVSIKFQHNIDSSSGDWLMLQNTILRDGLTKATNLDGLNKKNFLKEGLLIKEHKIEVLSGWQSSIRQHDGGTMINLSARSRILNKMTVLELIEMCIARKEDFESRLVGAVVVTLYNSGEHNNKCLTYKIFRVVMNENPSTTFEGRGGRAISFAEYFKEKYGISNLNMQQPLLEVKPTAKDIRGGRAKSIKLIPQLCYVTGLHLNQRKNIQLMNQVDQHTKKTPEQTVEFLKKFNTEIQGDATERLQMNGMTIEPSLIRITKARVIESELLLMRDVNGHKKQVKVSMGDWNKEVIAHKFYKSSTLDDWYFVYPKTLYESLANRFIGELKQTCIKFGMRWEKDPEMCIVDSNAHERVVSYKSRVQEILKKKNPRPKFVLLVNATGNPNSSRNESQIPSDIYKDFKLATMAMDGKDVIPTQVAMEKFFRPSKEYSAYVSSIALQVNYNFLTSYKNY